MSGAIGGAGPSVAATRILKPRPWRSGSPHRRVPAPRPIPPAARAGAAGPTRGLPEADGAAIISPMTDPAARPGIDAHLRRPWRERVDACAGPRGCEWPGCAAEARFPAPRSRERLRDYIFLCLEHVREYNSRWDYFSGMSTEQIDAHRRDDLTWHRPTWRFGTSPAGDCSRNDWHDVFGLFGEDARAGRPPPSGPTGKAAQMMARLDLEVGYTLAELKQRYKSLAKQHHPDLHGGDKAAEEKLKLINEAYRYLIDNELYA